MAKGPIGMLVRWLQVQQQYLDRDAHFKARSKTTRGVDLDYDHRREARSWLQECGAADIEYLFELEAERGAVATLASLCASTDCAHSGAFGVDGSSRKLFRCIDHSKLSD